MDKLKLIFIGLGVIFAAILLYFAVALVMGLFWYLAVFGVIALGGYGAYRFLRRPAQPLPELEGNRAERALADAQKTLKEYQRRIDKGN